MARTKTEIDYKVINAQDVVLSVAFGNGQLGASVVTGANATMGEVKNWIVGRGGTLRGQNIDIHSVVTDVNALTDNVNADYSLTGGDHLQTISLESTVPNNGDSERFRVVVNFV